MESALPNTLQWMALPRFLLFQKPKSTFDLLFLPWNSIFLSKVFSWEWDWWVGSSTQHNCLQNQSPAGPWIPSRGHWSHTPPHPCPWMQRPKCGLPDSELVGRKWKREFCGLSVLKGAKQAEFQLLTGIILLKCKALGPLSPSPKRNCKPNEAHQVMWLCWSRSQAFQAPVFHSCSVPATWVGQMLSVCSSLC